MSFSRRENLIQMGAITVLLATGVRSKAFASPAGRELPEWISRIDELTATLRGQTISTSEWRDGLDQLFQRTDLSDILVDIDFDRLKEATPYAALGVSTARIDIGKGRPQRLTFFPKLFAVDRQRAIIPHGHENMVSAHLTLGGRFHLRQYDQLDRDDSTMLVRPSFEGMVGAGDISSIGEVADNVHWFVAEEPSHTFDVVVTGLTSSAAKAYDIFNLDMDAGIQEGDAFRVPLMSVEDALSKYG